MEEEIELDLRIQEALNRDEWVKWRLRLRYAPIDKAEEEEDEL